MARQKALVIHDSELIRDLLTQYLMSEFANFQVSSASTLQEVQQWLETASFDLILSADLLRDATAIDLFNLVGKSSNNSQASFVVISHMGNQQEQLLYQEHGLQHWIDLPISAVEFSFKIQDVLFLRSKRKSSRYYISDLFVQLDTGEGVAHGEVKNISQTSISCELEAGKFELNFLQSQIISLVFPAEYESLQFTNIKCKLLQAKVVERAVDKMPLKYHIVLEFDTIPVDAQAKWVSLFEIIEKDVRSLEEKISQ